MHNLHTHLLYCNHQLQSHNLVSTSVKMFSNWKIDITNLVFGKEYCKKQIGLEYHFTLNWLFNKCILRMLLHIPQAYILWFYNIDVSIEQVWLEGKILLLWPIESLFYQKYLFCKIKINMDTYQKVWHLCLWLFLNLVSTIYFLTKMN